LYYREAHSDEPLSGLCLQEFELSLSATILTRFELNVPDRTYVLEAKNEEDRVAWLAALNKVKDEPKYSLLYGLPVSLGLGSLGAPIAAPVGALDDGEYLFKRGQKNPGWKQRYFLIRSGILYYYVSPSDKTPKGSSELKNCRVVPVTGDGSDGKYKFLVESPGRDGRMRKLYIYAETEPQRAKWMIKIKEAAQVNTVKSLNDQTGTDVTKLVEEVVPVKDSDAPPRPPFRKKRDKDRDTMKIVEQQLDNTVQNKTVVKDGVSIPEITELTSPTPVTSVFLAHRLYAHANEERRRDEEALKRARETGSTLDLQELGDDDSDDYLPDEELRNENCSVM